MHEAFLTAHVADDDQPLALKILQGHCAMKPEYQLHRRMYFQGPRGRVPGFNQAFLARQPPQRSLLWRSLQEQLNRQTYVIQLIYELSRDQFGKPKTAEEDGAEEGP